MPRKRIVVVVGAAAALAAAVAVAVATSATRAGTAAAAVPVVVSPTMGDGDEGNNNGGGIVSIATKRILVRGDFQSTPTRFGTGSRYYRRVQNADSSSSSSGQQEQCESETAALYEDNPALDQAASELVSGEATEAFGQENCDARQEQAEGADDGGGSGGPSLLLTCTFDYSTLDGFENAEQICTAGTYLCSYLIR